MNIWFTNADTLTKDKIMELKENIKCDSPPDIIAISEVKPKNYKREITEIDSQVSTSCCTYSTSTNNFWSYYCYSAAAISSWYFSIIS